jgi:hypothetical protein
MIILTPQAQRILATVGSFASLPAAAADLGLNPLAMSNADLAQLAEILAAAGFRQRLVNFVLIWIRGARI